ncbi:hypothetical protein L227DRAFT_568601 [Lentinus tigrinus ALCF2SS1-6]|uniref:Uncharacterized protein n=1 Tax=Lentinus tigrinus ALCF2SS1-6 TaxID=1328759 RepID=A0A5C2RLB3_9APHY|nr:hypothetical protein L227DRAFT_568601 [Lentinus tigrinus ALCF2SS1-6]
MSLPSAQHAPHWHRLWCSPQQEALIGILLSSDDSRVKGVLEDLAEASRTCSPRRSSIVWTIPHTDTRVTVTEGGPDEPHKSATRPTQGRQQRRARDSDQVIEQSAAHRNTLLPDDQFASRTVEDVDDEAEPEDVPNSLYPGESGYSNAASSISSSDLGPRRQQVPTLLLLTMFSLAARYSPSMADVSPPWSEDSTTWTMGDEHMEEAKVILGGYRRVRLQRRTRSSVLIHGNYACRFSNDTAFLRQSAQAWLIRIRWSITGERPSGMLKYIDSSRKGPVL